MHVVLNLSFFKNIVVLIFRIYWFNLTTNIKLRYSEIVREIVQIKTAAPDTTRRGILISGLGNGVQHFEKSNKQI